MNENIKDWATSRNMKKIPIKGVKHLVVVSSAKGGVGKSTFAANLALALKKLNHSVGLLDADIYGPSLPKIFNINEKPKSDDGKNLIPLEQYGIQCISIGFLTGEETPMIWRGPMVTSAIKTFTQKVSWKDLDFLIVDMPPGTGDTQLTFAQEIKVDGAVIISTPQEIALADVRRGINMFDKLKVPILGLVDNMSFFESEDGKKHNIFGEGGVEKLATDYKKKFLGKIPISIDLRIAADNGKPLMEENSEHKISKIFIDIAKKINKYFF